MLCSMINMISTTSSQGFARIAIEADIPELGFYIYVYETPLSQTPERDYLQDDLEMALLFCEEDLGVPRNSWTKVESTES